MLLSHSPRLISGAVCLLLLATASDCRAVTKTWTPFLGSDDWQFGANWSPSGEPTSVDDVIISVDNDLVVLNDDTTLVDSILLINGADLRTNGHTLNLNDTGNSGIVTIGNGVNLSRLELDPATGKSADIDNLQLFDGGQLDMDGGLIEIDNQLVMSAGSEIVGQGTIDLVRTGGTAALLGGEVRVSLAATLGMNAANGGVIDFRDADVLVDTVGTLSVVSASGEVDLGEANFAINPGATVSIDAPIRGDYSGTIVLTESEATFEVAEAWAMAGEVRMVGFQSGDRRTGILRGGPTTVTGTIELEDATRLRIQSRTTFAASADVIIDDDSAVDVVSAEIVIEEPAVLDGASFVGDGALVAQAGLTVSSDTTFSTGLQFDLPNRNLTGLAITDGATFTHIGPTAQPPGTLNFVFEDIRIEMEENTTLRHAFGDWVVGGNLRMADGATVGALGGQLQMQGLLFVTDGEAVIESRVEFRQTTGISGLIGGDDGTTLRVEGDTVYRNAENFGNTISIIQNGDGHADNGTLLEGELFAIAGSDGANTDFEFRHATTGNTTVAGGVDSVGVVELNGQWDVNGSLYIGGTRTEPQGQGTLNVGSASSGANDGMMVQEVLRVYPTGAVNVAGAKLTTDNLVFDNGATFTLVDGVVTVDGGVGRLPDASFAFGGGAGADPEFNARNGADVAVTSGWTIGDLADTSGRTEVTGLGPLDVPSTLRSTSDGSAADLRVGNAGDGELLVSGGGMVEFGDAIIVGRLATSLGRATVDGVSAGVRSTLRSRTGVIAVGSLGTGTLDITDGALVEADDDVYIAQTPGSTGQIHLFQTNTPDNGGFDSQLVVGDDLVVGGGTSSGGFGTLIVDEGGRVDVVEALLIRSANSRMTVNGGEFSTARLIHTLGGELQLFSGRGEIGGIDTNAAITIGDGASATPMELVVDPAALNAPFRDVEVASNGVLSVEGVASADTLQIASGGKLRVEGRFDVDVLADGVGHIELAGGALALNGLQPSRVGHDLTIVSEGTIEVAAAQAATLAGTIAGGGDSNPDGLAKTGAGKLVLESANHYAGTTTVSEGNLVAANATGSATGTGQVLVSGSGVVSGDGAIGQVTVGPGGSLAPGTDNELGVLSVEGLRFEGGGTVEFDLAGPTPGSLHDQLQVDLDADLSAGVLQIDLAEGYTPSFGDRFVVIEAAGGINGAFDSVVGGTLAGGLLLDVLYSSNSVTLEVVASFLPGDYNDDGSVDAADYTVWRDHLGAPAGALLNDPVGGTIGEAHYNIWRAHFGSQAPPSGAAVPEPAAAGTALAAALAFVAVHQRRVAQRHGRHCPACPAVLE